MLNPQRPTGSAPNSVSGGGRSGTKNTAYTMQRRLISSKVHEFELVSDFEKMGYRNREDITILPPGVMVLGSYNVLTNVNGRIGVTKGYTLDGQANVSLKKISSSFDFSKLVSNDTHVRTYGTNLDFRYINPFTSIISWITIYSGLTDNDSVNFCSYWDITQVSNVTLFVNNTPNIYRWSGAQAVFFSATTNTITLNGTKTWEQLGFDVNGIGTIDYVITSPNQDFQSGETITGVSSSATAVVTQNVGTLLVFDTISGTFTPGETITGGTSGATATVTTYTAPATLKVIIKGTEYTYTGGESTFTLTGVTPDPSGAGYVIGDAVAQSVINTGNNGAIALDPTFNNTLIGNLDNQIFIGSTTSAVIYTSNVNSYLDYSNDNPRLVGQGAVSTIAGYPTAFINQEDNLYVSAGKDLWYETLLTTSLAFQSLTYQQLKTTGLQAAQSQAATTKIKNDITFLSFEPIINTLGRVDNVVLTPQVTDLSYSIVNDMNRYDWTDAAMIYYRQFLYVSVPKEGLIRIYNMTQPKIQYWEAPVTFPIGRWSIINDELYGHGYTTPQTYKLFDGYTFNGSPIAAAAYFSYNQYGTRAYPKSFEKFYLEGYITSNCTLTYGLNYDINGCQTQRMFTINGSQTPLVCSILPDASLGKESLGKRPLSGLTIPGNISTNTDTGLPPKFRAIKQVSKFPFYELQVFFESLGTGQQWELIAFGPDASPATEGTNSIQY